MYLAKKKNSIYERRALVSVNSFKEKKIRGNMFLRYDYQIVCVKLS